LATALRIGGSFASAPDAAGVALTPVGETREPSVVPPKSGIAGSWTSDAPVGTSSGGPGRSSGTRSPWLAAGGGVTRTFGLAVVSPSANASLAVASNNITRLRIVAPRTRRSYATRRCEVTGFRREPATAGVNPRHQLAIIGTLRANHGSDQSSPIQLKCGTRTTLQPFHALQVLIAF